VNNVGRVNDYIQSKLSNGEKLHFTLIDPDKVSDVDKLYKLAEEVKSYGTDAFLIGGSLGVTPEEAGVTAKVLKETGLPVIIFPGNLNCLTPNADAVLFMVLMNSIDTYYLIEAQVAAAPIIRKYGLETLPTAYIVVYGDTAVAHVGRVYPLPPAIPEMVYAYALAAEMMGFKYIYLEAGSGAQRPIPFEMPRIVKKYTNLTVIAGGGIRDAETASRMVENGVDIIVTGTILERDPGKLAGIIKAVKRRDTSS